MAKYLMEKSFTQHTESTPNVQAVAEMFGLGARREQQVSLLDHCEIEIEPGEVVYITGGSGAGKSLCLNLLKEQFPDAVDLEALALPSGKAVVDCFEGNLSETLQWLSLAGLSDAYALLRRPEELSDGQRYRLRLALALAQLPPVICIDEFCATLDRVTAAVVAHNVRRFADRFVTTFIVATSHDDLLEDLAPDVVVVKHLGSQCDVYYPGRMKLEAS